MRAVEHSSNVAVLELRGGTDLVLVPSDEVAAGEAPFDLMVDDLDATHAGRIPRRAWRRHQSSAAASTTRSRSPTPTATGCT